MCYTHVPAEAIEEYEEMKEEFEDIDEDVGTEEVEKKPAVA